MVKLKIVWDIEAKAHLKKLYLYIKQDSPQNAISVRNSIIERVNHAATYPESFSSDKYKIDNDGTYKAFELYHYRISYKIDVDVLIVLRIRHTSQSPLNY